jgi:ABC-type transport system involved in cytochrome c biogenesis ATPase subunit
VNELDLLDPFRRSIEHLGREQDMATLWGWLHASGKPVTVRVVTGRAGAGKTRMAVEIITRLEQEEPGQWHAGFATGRELRRFIEGKAAVRNPLAGEM